MKNLLFFLLGLVVATGFWFYMGYLQVDGNRLEKYLHRDKADAEEVTIAQESLGVEPDAELEATEPEPETELSIIGRWRIADPVGYEEREKMLSFDEYGTFKFYRNTSSGYSYNDTYTVEGNTVKYGRNNSIQFNLIRVDGVDYLEIFNNTSFGGKWVRQY